MADIDMQRENTGAALRRKINKLTLLAEQQQAMLQENLNIEMGALLRTAGRSGVTETVVGQAMQYTMFQMFDGERHELMINDYKTNLEHAILEGTKGYGAGMSMDKLAPEMTKVYSDMITQNGMSLVTNMENDLKSSLTDMFNTALMEDKMPSEISAMIRDEFGVSQARADSIARTETMRANNQIAYDQAVANGATHYIVDNREESCEECQMEYEGEVFDISDTSALPPLHPNCACVPSFFNDLDEAQAWTDNIQFGNMVEREEKELEGMMVSPDGTGSFPIDIERRNAMDLMENTPLMTIPRSDRYKQEKAIYKKVRQPILQARQKAQYPERAKTVQNIKNGTAKQFNTNKVHIEPKERRVYELHIHSSASPDSTESVANIVKEAKKLKLDGVAITNHNNLSESIKAAEKYSTKNFKVIPGVEITSSKGHIIALGIKNSIRSGMSPERTIRAIKRQGGIAILPHSMARYRDGVLYKTAGYASRIGRQAHSLETVNARYGQGATNYMSRNFAEKHSIGQIAGSDAHSAKQMGMALTEIKSRNNTVEEILNSIKNGHTNAYDSQIPVSKLSLTPIQYPKGTELNPIRYPEAQLPYGTRVLKEKIYNFGINDKSIDDFHVVKITTQFDKHYKEYTAIVVGRSESSGTTVATTIPLGKVKKSAREWNTLIKSKFDQRPGGATPIGN